MSLLVYHLACTLFPLICYSAQNEPVSAPNNKTDFALCDQYDVFESQFHCGEDGYFLEFGKRYCNRFFEPEIFKDFDDVGKKFVQCVGVCLVKDLREYLENNPAASCTAITDRAFETHVDCYTQCGFCGACQHNWMTLRRVFSIKDFLSLRALKSVEGVANGCGGAVKAAISCLFG